MCVVMAMIAMVTVHTAQGSEEEDLSNLVYEKRMEKFGVPANFSCVREKSNEYNKTVDTVEHWILPNNRIVLSNYSDENLTVSVDGLEMYVRDVSNETTGMYLCRMNLSNGQLAYSRTKLHYKPNLWKVYDKNIYVGLLAAGSLLLLCALLCLAQRYKWYSCADDEDSEKESNLDGKPARNSSIEATGHVNPVYEAGGIEETTHFENAENASHEEEYKAQSMDDDNEIHRQEDDRMSEVKVEDIHTEDLDSDKTMEDDIIDHDEDDIRM